MIARISLILACAWALSACASTIGDTSQAVMVDTMPMPGASCTLENGRGAWHVPRTPGAAFVAKSYTDLVVTCRDGHGAAGRTVAPSEGDGAVLGNILLGGLIGLAVDMSSGAAYEYPQHIMVEMVPGGRGTMPGNYSAPPALPGRTRGQEPVIRRIDIDPRPDRMTTRQPLPPATSGGFCCGPLRP